VLYPIGPNELLSASASDISITIFER